MVRYVTRRYGIVDIGMVLIVYTSVLALELPREHVLKSSAYHDKG